MYVGGLPLAQAGPVTKIRPSLLSPANQAVLTVSSPAALAARGSLPLLFAKNGTAIGGGTTPGGGVANLTWTPASTDFNGQLVAQNNVGVSASRTIVVAEANRFTTAASSGTKTNFAVVLDAGTDPFYGGPLYKVTAAVNATAANHILALTATAGTAGINSGLEIVIEASAGFPVVQIYPTTGDNHRYCQINIATGETVGNWGYAKVIERKGNFARVWFRPEVYAGVAYATQAVGFYFAKALSAGLATVTDGTETLRISQPRSVDGVLPFTNAQLLQARFDGVVSSADRWILRSGFVNDAAGLNADMLASRETAHSPVTYDYQNRGALGVLKPDTYTTAKKYRVIYMLTIEGPILTAAYGDPLYIVQQAGLHNSMDCIFVCSTLKGNLPWYGANADGVTQRFDAFIRDQIVGLVDERYSTLATQEGRSLLGFSKSGWGALSLILRNPATFGYAAAWDVPWGLAYSGASVTIPGASYPEIAVQFGTEAQFHLFNPQEILTTYAAGVTDRKRLVIAGGCAFNSDLPPFRTALASAGISYTYRFNDLSSAAGNHQWNSGWLPNVLADLSALWDGTAAST